MSFIQCSTLPVPGELPPTDRPAGSQPPPPRGPAASDGPTAPPMRAPFVEASLERGLESEPSPPHGEGEGDEHAWWGGWRPCRGLGSRCCGLRELLLHMRRDPGMASASSDLRDEPFPLHGEGEGKGEVGGPSSRPRRTGKPVLRSPLPFLSR